MILYCCKQMNVVRTGSNWFASANSLDAKSNLYISGERVN